MASHRRSGGDTPLMTDFSVSLATAMDILTNATSTRQSMTSSCRWISKGTMRAVVSVRSASTSQLGSTVTLVLTASSGPQVSYLMPQSPAYPVTVLMLATLGTVLQTMGCASARRPSGVLRTVQHVRRDFMTTQTANHVLAFLMEQWLMNTAFPSVQAEERTCSVRAKKILEEHFVMSVPLDITTFRSVLLVSVILKHPRTRFVTRKMASSLSILCLAS